MTVLLLSSLSRRPSLPRGEMLANAPDRHGDFFRVPRIIEE